MQPAAVKTKPAKNGAPGGAGGDAPRQPLKAANVNVAGAAGAGGGKGKSVEEIYQKKTQLEHILLRPDSYSAWQTFRVSHVGGRAHSDSLNWFATRSRRRLDSPLSSPLQ